MSDNLVKCGYELNQDSIDAYLCETYKMWFRCISWGQSGPGLDASLPKGWQMDQMTSQHPPNPTLLSSYACWTGTLAALGLPLQVGGGVSCLKENR